MAPKALLKVLLDQVDQLQKVTARLESVAEEHPFITEPLLKISETIRSCATFLDVLIATKLNTEPA
jgi:hypothetical protein